jgi:TonB family protein
MIDRRLVVLAGSLAATLSATPLTAQPAFRCDCTSVVDTCSASVTPRGSYLDVTSDSQQCSRVDYFVDGQPFVSVVVGGEDKQDWLARTAQPKVIVQSCQVCRDTTSAAGSAPPATPAAQAPGAPVENDGAAKLQPLIAGEPQYPATARARRIEGHVDVEFTVTPEGTVEKPHVVASEPKGVFDAAALAAVARWRYAAEPGRAPQTLTERVDFKLPARDAASPGPAAATSMPRNQCVREDTVYNYGEMVDVDLINACGQPLLVFGCSEGTGKYAGRWVCNTSEQQGSVLVAQNDRRLGRTVSLPSTDGVRIYTYTDEFSVTRAPNSQYWWVACSEQDATCHSQARLWTRAVGGQPASVDPQSRSAIAVASSR